MVQITKLQKLGIAVLVVSLVGSAVGTVLSIDRSFSALEKAESIGIGPVGDQIFYALLFSVGGIVGFVLGLVLFIVGRQKS